MSVKLSEYTPVTHLLFPRPDGEEDKDWECPIPGMEDVWVRVIPPSWGVDRERQQFVNGWHTDQRLSVLDVAQYEIALCYGGSNMVVMTMKRDENGRYVFTEEEPGYEFETVKFDSRGQLSIEEVLARISKLPRVIVEAWHARTLGVASGWSTKFRQ